MTVLVFGGKGRTGQKIVELLKNSDVKIFEGDVLNYEEVSQALLNTDVVASVLGHVKGSDNRVQTKGMLNIVKSMQEHGVKRIISLTGTGVRFTGDKISLVDRVLNLSIRIIDKHRVLDGIEHAEVLKNSDLDWTVLRVLKLSNGKADSNWQLTAHGPAKLLIARESVALAFKELIENNSFIKQAPVISKR